MQDTGSIKILFFIGTLLSGGKERRLIELLKYLKANTEFELMLLLRRDMIDYPAFYELGIPYMKLTESYRKGDKTLHFKFNRICKAYKPSIIHTWGSMPAFVSILAVRLQKIPHVNSQITDAPPILRKWSRRNIINKINFRFSTVILANSYAGLKTYRTNKNNCRVIYNGIDLNRFNNLPDKNIIRRKYNISTPKVVIMVASFTDNKNYDLFIDVARTLRKGRDDVTFLAIGGGINLEHIMKKVHNNKIDNVLFTGRIDDVEALVNTADIGVLFTNNYVHGEGISNSILEYMALGKPVIANDAGGTREIIKHGINGYLITNESPDIISEKIDILLSNKEKSNMMGEAGRKMVQEVFTIDRMGREFEKVYKDLLDGRGQN